MIFGSVRPLGVLNVLQKYPTWLLVHCGLGKKTIASRVLASLPWPLRGGCAAILDNYQIVVSLNTGKTDTV